VSTPLPRSEFAVTQRYVYLNHAAAGVLPAVSVREIERFARAHAGSGVLGTFAYDLKLDEYRQRIGAFIGGSGEEIALVLNTSAGASTVAQTVDWAPGDEVVLCDYEFPANVIPWLALRQRGVNVRVVAMQREHLTPDRLQREISPRTRAVAVSWVSYADGYRHDLGGLAAVAHSSGALLCVDAMQGLGVLPIRVRELGVDALYAGAAKWMLGLHGAAFVYLSPQLNSRSTPAMPGWRSMANMWDFHNYEHPFTTAASRFEGGTPNVVGALSMVCAIDLFERCGTAAIAEHVMGLTDRLYRGLSELDVEILSQRGPECSSGIVTFSLRDCDSMAVGRALEGEGIVTTYRSSGIRVSPHGYNTAEEIDAMLDSLKRIACAKVSV